MTVDPDKFGTFVQERRKELGMTQSELAEKLFVTPKAVSRWERGIGFPDIRLLQPLAEALEITLVELMHSERIEKALSREEASDLISETVEQMEQQRKITGKRKLLLYTGYALIFAAYMVVHGVAQISPLKPKWLGIPLILIACFGLQYGTRALKAILTRTPFPYQELKNPPMTKAAWVALGCFLGGLALLLFVMAKLPSNTPMHDALVVLSLCLSLFGGVYYYQYVSGYQEKK